MENNNPNPILGIENKKMRSARKSKEKASSPEELERNKKAALYLRVSSEMQRNNFSISAQKEECMKYALEKGYTVAEENICIDEAFTAKNEDRPAFKKLLADAHEGQFSLIVAHKMDRLYRNTKAMLTLIDELRKINVTMYCAHQHMELTNDLTCTIIAAVSKQYLDNLADEVAKGKRQAVKEGNYIGSIAPFGYKFLKSGFPGNEGGKQRKLVPHEKEAPALIKCFEMYASGNYSFQDLADYLNNTGFVPRRNEKWKNAFTEDTLRTMMDNPVYVGILIYQNENSEKGYEEFIANHEALIDPVLFKNVAEIRQSRVTNHKHNKANGGSLKSHYLVHNLVCCAACGRRLRVHSGKKKFRYKEYSENRGLSCEYNGEYVDAQILDSCVRDFVRTIVFPRSWIEAIEKKNEGQDFISKIQSKIKNIQERIKRRTNAFTVNGTFTFEEFQKEHNADMAELEELKAKLPKSSDLLKTQITITTSLIDLFVHATSIEQNEIVHHLFKKLYFDFEKFRLSAFEPEPEFDFLFSTFAEKNNWKKENDRYLLPE